MPQKVLVSDSGKIHCPECQQTSPQGKPGSNDMARHRAIVHDHRFNSRRRRA